MTKEYNIKKDDKFQFLYYHATQDYPICPFKYFKTTLLFPFHQATLIHDQILCQLKKKNLYTHSVV